MASIRKTILDKLQKKYSLDMQIEPIRISKKSYYAFTGYTLGNEFDFQITTESGKILLFESIKEICEYFANNNKKELYYSNNTYKFLKALRPKARYVQAYYKRFIGDTIGIDNIRKIIKTKKMGNKDRALSDMFEVLILFRSLFRQKDDKKNLKKINTKLYNEYIDVIWDPYNKKYTDSIKKICKDKNFIEMVNDFDKYFLVYKN